MTHRSVTGIGELVTNDADARRRHPLGRRCTTPRWSSRTARSPGSGPAAQAPAADRRIDVGGRAVVPGLRRLPHPPGLRRRPRRRVRGPDGAATRYDGGGIASTVAATRAADRRRAARAARARGSPRCAPRARRPSRSRAATGSTVDRRGARAAAGRARSPPETTFLGAHVVPARVRRTARRLRRAGHRPDARAPARRTPAWIDVFCEPASPHAFDGDEARAVLEAGRGGRAGPAGARQPARPRPGRPAGRRARRGERRPLHVPDRRRRRRARRAATTVATLLPGVEFSTRSPYPDARRLLDAGVDVALATDCNPGTCYTSSMPFVIALAVREMGMTPAEAL